MKPRHPEIEVTLIGEEGNAFSILGRVQRALREGGVPDSEVREFLDEASSGDYDHLLATVIEVDRRQMTSRPRPITTEQDWP